MHKPVEILLVEDDPGDAELTREALEEAEILINLNIVEDGVKAMAYLRQEGAYASAVRPDLILLDLNLPRKDGREVLNELKRDENLKYIPVVVMTTSDAEEDIFVCYNLGANCYVTKPLGLDEFTHLAKSIEEFWLKLAKLPHRG